jgi:hypothetical protein
MELLQRFIMGGRSLIDEAVEDVNLKLKGKGKVTASRDFKISFGVTQDCEVVYNPIGGQTTVAQLSFMCTYHPEAPVETPAMKALAETTEKKETTKKGKGNK